MNLNFSPFPVLTTERLNLRQLISADAENIHHLRSDEAVNKMVGRKTSKGITDAQAFIAQVQNMTKNSDGIYWVIELKEGSQFAGTICLYNFDNDKQEVEIGYELLPAFYGKGLASEAVIKVTKYAFDTIGANVVTANPAEVNTPSVRLLEKLNFKLSGSFTVGSDRVVLLGYHLQP